MPNSGFDNSPGFLNNVVNNATGQLAGIISTRPNAKFMSGARCTLKVNGKLVGFAFAITWNINTAVTEINTIDNYLPYELAPQRVTVDGTISALHIPGESANTDGWQGNVLSFLFQPYISIQAIDSATQQIIFSTDKATIVSRSEEIRVDQLSNVTLRWRAIGYIDEAKPQIDNDAHNYNQSTETTSVPTSSNTNPIVNTISGAASSISNAVNGINIPGI
jgi:hypothetical protein